MRTKKTTKPQAISTSKTEPVKKRGPTRNVKAGHNWERDMVNVLKEVGFEHVCTTRSESRARDNAKIDIMNKDEYKNGRLPFNIQCKNLVTTTVHGGLDYNSVLNSMPQDGSETNVIFHNMTQKRGFKFMLVGQFAHLKLYDFIMLMKKIKDLEMEIALLKEGKLIA
jgi:hypothetical protein